MEPSSASSKRYFRFYRHCQFPWVYFVAVSCHLCSTNKVSWKLFLMGGLLSQFFHSTQKHQCKVVFKTLSLSILFPLMCRTLKQIPIWWWQPLAENTSVASIALDPMYKLWNTICKVPWDLTPVHLSSHKECFLFFLSVPQIVKALFCLWAFVAAVPSASVFPHLCLVRPYSSFPSQYRCHLFYKSPLIAKCTFSTLPSSRLTLPHFAALIEL